MPFVVTRAMRRAFAGSTHRRGSAGSNKSAPARNAHVSPPSIVFQAPPLGVVIVYTPGWPATPWTDVTGPPSNGPVHRQVKSA
jgi:hypothetical protein